MHELGMARDLFKVILDRAAELKLSRITRIVITAGEASGIDPEFLLHSFEDHIFPGTPAEGCRVEILPEKVAVVCGECAGEIPGDEVFACRACGSDNFVIAGGKDVAVKDVEGTC